MPSLTGLEARPTLPRSYVTGFIIPPLRGWLRNATSNKKGRLTPPSLPAKGQWPRAFLRSF